MAIIRGHGADADQSNVLIFHVLRDASFIHGLGVAVNKQDFMFGRGQRLEQKHPEVRHEVASYTIVRIVEKNSQKSPFLELCIKARALPHGGVMEAAEIRRRLCLACALANRSLSANVTWELYTLWQEFHGFEGEFLVTKACTHSRVGKVAWGAVPAGLDYCGDFPGLTSGAIAWPPLSGCAMRCRHSIALHRVWVASVWIASLVPIGVRRDWFAGGV